MNIANQARHEQRGMVLITSLLLLLILTMLAVSMFRSYGVEEKIAGNTRDKQRARSAAISAQQFAENYLSTTATALASSTCAGTVPSTGAIPVCNAPLADFTAVPWTVGVTYTQFTANAINGVSNVVKTSNATGDTATQAASYYASPMFYITDLGAAPVGLCASGGEVYQIDAVGYGGTANTVAVVESTYMVGPSTCKPADK